MRAQKPGAETQQRRFSSSVGALQQHDLRGVDLEVDPGKSREAAEQHDRTAQRNDGHNKTLPADVVGG